MQEKHIQKQILDHLELKGHFHWRNNTGAMKAEHGSFIKFGAVGSPDIFILTQGGFLVQLEVKAPKGKQNEAQKEWQRKSEELGAEYYVVRSLDEVIELGF